MNWYYVDAGNQSGPVSDEQIEDLRRSGKITEDTLVWKEGMTDWLPYRQAKPSPTVAAATATPVFTSGTWPAVTTAGVVCAECGRHFDPNDMIKHGEVFICAGCKPIFMQKLAEGAKIDTGAMNYAGFWIRFAAKFVDGIITNIVTFPLGFISGLMVRGQQSPETIIVTQLIVTGISLAFTLGYNVFFVGKYGATPGKMVFKLKIVMSDGNPVSYGRATGRFFAEILSSLICMIGYIMAGFDEEKRALHDRICNTRVIYK